MSAVLLIFYVSVLSGCGQKEMDSGSARAKAKEMDAMKEIYLAGGCFWGVQKFFDQFDGVVVTEVGYANGLDSAPSYREVCDSSGHAETVRIGYDEGRITVTKLLDYYFMGSTPFPSTGRVTTWVYSSALASTTPMKASWMRSRPCSIGNRRRRDSHWRWR